jgi:FkbM family methyltransferase
MKPRPPFLIALGLVAAAALGYAVAFLTVPPPLDLSPVFVGPAEAPLARVLRARYGPHRNSEELEEWILRDYFQDERGGVFVDVGANHHQTRNNTYYLETTLGWSGVAVEPQAQFADGYRRFRPRTTFVPLFVSNVSDQDATLWVPGQGGNHRIASFDRAFAESPGIAADAVRVRTITLDDLLDRLQIPRIDFLTMDIELAEPMALAGFSIERFRPRLICIEAHEGVQQQILEYVARHGYVLIAKYLPVDRDNFWFAKAGDVKDEPARH